MFSRLSLAAGALAGGILVFSGMQTVNALWIIPGAREEGRKLERAELEAATTKAIGELANEADQARFNRRLCIERGRVYLNSSGKCVERPPQPGG
ncbi:hypothetical protein CN150_13310 [Sinorhizobium meliloti]|uniref:hypothetical protein n=1 Tax=Rhizobium meliloti TaxID=382 RepID=UPI000FE0055E|nr:hypothetical protein [Sinorhizobium meliloti]RVK96165.1 hypothetical protein CN150_13310 [Sinorhizobium meliloti]